MLLKLNHGDVVEWLLQGNEWLLLMVQKSGDSPVEVGSLSHYLQGFSTHPRWLLGISSINSINGTPKSSILTGFSIRIRNHPFLGYHYFWKNLNVYQWFFQAFFKSSHWQSSATFLLCRGNLHTQQLDLTLRCSQVVINPMLYCHLCLFRKYFIT